MLHVRTPLIESTPLSAAAGRPVLLKVEATQPSASFKIRGIGLLCEKAVAAGARSFVGSSGGNAGLATAYAGRKLGVPTTIVVPSSTPPLMRERIAAERAEVIVAGDIWDAAHAHALELAKRTDAVVVPPFDHPDIWEGHATMVDELAEVIDPPGALVVAVGGGGLLCGVALGLQQQEAGGWDQVPVVAVETTGAASLAAACAAGKVVPIPAIDSIAKSLGAQRVAHEALRWAQRRDVRCVQVTDREAVSACERFLDDHRLLVEPACGAALAPVYAASAALAPGPIVVIVCGGAGVTHALLRHWRQSI